METKAQVVSKGMRWTPDMARKALEQEQYIKVGDKGGFLTLSGAPNRWKKYPQDIYVSDLRIAGHLDVVAQVLRSAGYADSQVQQALSNCYTSQNYLVPSAKGGKAELYQSEVSRYKQYKETQKTQKTDVEGPTIILRQLDFLVNNLPNALQNKVTSSRKNGSPKKAGTKSVRGSKVPLLTRLQEAQKKGKVLDVSNMREGGTNIKTIDAPGPGSKKFMVPGLGLVSSNIQNYVTAVNMLPAEYHKYINIYKQQCGGKTGGGEVLAPTGLPQVPVVSGKATTSESAVTLPTLPTLPHVAPVGSKIPQKMATGGKPQIGAMARTLPQVPSVGSPRNT